MGVAAATRTGRHGPLVAGSHLYAPRRAARGIETACSCGWVAVGRASTDKRAREAFDAHLYAVGCKVTADVELVTTPASDPHTAP